MTALGAISAGDVAVHGTVLGLVYGMLAVGLVLVYRASRVVNFAHGETGALGAALLAKLVLDDGWSWFAALPVVLCVGALVGGLTQHLIGRRLAVRPRVALLTATIGLSQVLVVLQLLLPRIHHLAPYPTPVHRHLRLFGATVAGGDFTAVAVTLSMAVGLWLWLGRTPTGLALGAASDNVDAARLAGVRVDRVALAAWAIAGVMATATAVVAGPVQGVIVGRETEGLGVGLLVRALAPALVARMRSVLLALGGGVVVGILQVASDTSGRDPALADVAVLILVVVALFLGGGDRRGHGPGETELVPVPASGPIARWRGPWIVALAAAAALPVVAGRSSQLFFCSGVALFAVVGLSVVLLTGWTGQLSLGQVAFVGIGTLTAAELQRVGVPFWLSVPCAGAAAAGLSLLVGLPALRVRQIELAVVTLAFAVACRSWLFTRPALLATGGTLTVHRGRLAGLDTTTSVAYFETCVVALALAVALLLGVRRSGFGRMLLAVRSNERGAAALGVRPVRVKLAAFGLAGAMAGAAGALLGGLRVHSGAADFGPEESLRVLAIAVIGGAGSVAGVVAGALVVLGIPALFGGTAVATLLTSGAGLLVLVLFAPGGLASVVSYLVGAVPRSSTEEDAGDAPGGAVGRLPPPSGDGGPAGAGVSLEVREITVAYGGNRVLDAVSLRAAAGEVIALIGPNGAGKSTLLDVISGYRSAGSGCVLVDDVDLGAASPSRRARRGLGRVFQDARLFDDLTVGEVVELAAGCAERHDRDAARSALALLGLTPLRGRACQHLSTGTRRMVEMACVVAARPRLLLLDEPTAGLGQRESEAFAPLLVDVQRHLGATIVLVEHDLDLVVAVAPRIVCLSAGRVIADGPGAGVLHESAVIAAYTGMAAGQTPTSAGPG